MAAICPPTHPGCDRDLCGLLVDLDTIQILLHIEIEMNTHLGAVLANLNGPRSVRFDIYELRHLKKLHPARVQDA